MLRFTCLLPALLFSISAFAVTGERWEYSNQMNMPGMNLPAHSTKVCKEAGWEKPPQDAQKSDCQMSEFKRSGNSMTWSMKCPQGDAHGQMTIQDNDNFTGTTVFEGKQGKFTMNMTGHRIGTCEIGAGEGLQVEGVPGKARVQQ